MARSRHALPEWQSLADRLGLNYRPSPVAGKVGELNGILRGHRALVRPDRPALYVEYRFRVAGLRLSTEAPPTTAAPDFSTGHGVCDRLFAQRTASPAAGEALRAALPFHADISALATRWNGRWAGLEFDEKQFTLTLGRRGFLARGAAVKAGEVEALLPDMVSVVESLETALREHAVRAAL